MKYLLLFAVLLAIWWYWRTSSRRKQADEAPPAERPVEAMVTCAQCGVHLPVSDSIAEAGLHFCSEAHRRAGRR